MGFEEPQVITADQCVPETRPDGVTWYTIDGVHDVDILRRVGENFSLHPLVVEDLANTGQRPKLEEFDDYEFIALKMITYDAKEAEVKVEHVSIILGNGWVLSFLEDEGDVFEPVRQRIKSGKGRIRRMRADYLAYALIDSIVDCYFQVLEEIGEEIERVEEEVVNDARMTTLRSVHKLKRELIFLRRSVWPMREIANSLIRDESVRITEETKLFLRDLYDHTIHAIDTIETQRDIVSGMLDVYLSSVSNKMNEVMKLLTVMSSIFIPLTFVAGVYGMNMPIPENEWEWSYPAFWVVCLLIVAAMLSLFRRRGWL